MFVGVVSVLILFVFIQRVSADTAVPDAPSVQTVQAQLDTLINNHIKSLTAILAKFKTEKNVSQSHIAGTQASINALTALKTKVDSETDLTSLMADEAEFFEEERGVVPNTVADPEVRAIATLQKGIASINKQIAAISAKAASNSNGANLQTRLVDATSKINDATTQLNQAEASIQTLVPVNGNKNITASNKTILNGVDTTLDAARADIRAAQKDIHSVLFALNPRTSIVKN